MEWFPESWLWEPLDGPFAYEQVPYITIGEDYSQQQEHPSENEPRRIYQCLLCETGEMNSEKVCKEHVYSSKHQKRYKLLDAQQKSFHQEMKLPDNFVYTMQVTEEGGHVPSEPPFDNTLDYILPFRRWQYGRWRNGSCCQLCGTAGITTRLAVVQHFLTSKRHQTIRSRTFWQHHPEFGRLEERFDKLCSLYQWHVERAMIAYVAHKEASHAGLASHPYAWYQLLWTLETYELRERMVHLELAIWKYSLLHYAKTTSFANVKELLVFFLKPSQDEEKTTSVPPMAEYWKVKRVTSGAMQIIQCVIPYLRSYPKL